MRAIKSKDSVEASIKKDIRDLQTPTSDSGCTATRVTVCRHASNDIITIFGKKKKKKGEGGWHHMLQGTLQSNCLIIVFPNTIRLFFIHLYIECQHFLQIILVNEVHTGYTG